MSATPAKTSTFNAELFRARSARLVEIITEVLDAKLAAGALAPVPGHDDHQIHTLTSWNNLISGKGQSWDRKEVLDALARCWRLKISPKVDEMSELAFEDWARALVEAGTTPDDPLGIVCDSAMTKDRYQLVLKDWTLSVFAINPDWHTAPMKDRRDIPYLLPMTPIGVTPCVSMPIDFPTGRLIIADWIRIQAFTEAVKNDAYQLNFTIDRMERTIAGVRTHNLIEVAVGDCGPDVFRLPGAGPEGDLLFGSQLYDEETDHPIEHGHEELASVIADYWATTVIDYADLMRILTAAGVEDPDAAFEAWKTGPWQGGFNEVQVAPGRWYLTFIDQDVSGETQCLEDAGFAAVPGLETVIRLSRTAPEIDPAKVRLA